ncbi:hypothetical protein N8D56_20170 [Devosia sp. A8/3-2]|nr:hypothetical protein N8D56_20170 [Devosia sp. A8/3-2]
MSLTLADGLIIAAILAAIPALMLLVRLLGRRFGWNPEVSRKLVHVGTGSPALTFPLLFSNPLPVLLLLGMAIPLMFAIRSGLLGGLGNVLHGVERQSYGEVYLALAIAITFLRAEEQPVLYVLPILVITLSDTAAALIGTAYGRQRFPVEGGAKSIEGVVVFFVITRLASLIVLVLMSNAAPLNLVLISMLIAAFCALVEVDSRRGLDNLFVPIGAFLLLARYLDSSPAELAVSAAVFLGFLVAVLAVARALRLPQQAARLCRPALSDPLNCFPAQCRASGARHCHSSRGTRSSPMPQRARRFRSALRGGNGVPVLDVRGRCQRSLGDRAL